MSQKKNQHIVPACYLTNFISQIPEEHKNNKKYEGGVYVNNTTLSDDWNIRSVGHGLFTESYFYTLEKENKDNPSVENFLSTVEGNYRKYSKEIFSENITNDNLSFLSYFTMIQYIRTKYFMRAYQSSWDNIAKHADDFNGDDSYKNEVKDLAKKQILYLELGDKLHSHAYIIYNQTSFPFITSDTPVVKVFINITEALTFFPKEYVYENTNKSEEFAFFFFPLSPNVAYVSCELLKSELLKSELLKSELNTKLYFDNKNLVNIYNLNYKSIIHAHEFVYSSIKYPLDAKEELSQELVSLKNPKPYVRIYTNSQRIIAYARREAFSDYQSITLCFEDVNDLNRIVKNEDVKAVEFIENGTIMKMMKFCYIADVNTQTGIVRIESKLKLPL